MRLVMSHASISGAMSCGGATGLGSVTYGNGELDNLLEAREGLLPRLEILRGSGIVRCGGIVRGSGIALLEKNGTSAYINVLVSLAIFCRILTF